MVAEEVGEVQQMVKVDQPEAQVVLVVVLVIPQVQVELNYYLICQGH